MINASDIKRGVTLELDVDPWLVIDCAFQTPSARGASTLTKVRIRNLKSGAVLNKSYRGGEMLQEADCEKRAVQFLYKDEDGHVFMDQETYDQVTLGDEVLGDSAGYLTEGLECRSLLHNGLVINIELPNTVELEVVECMPYIKGATAQAQLKPATLETGLEIQVPPYLEPGEKIRVDTRDGRFIERVKG
ncbi:MAG: elongation factor P [Deltaproteobacteria bacterium]|nr:elongation factor P [Deltaproteobacteria bacterium]